MRFKNVMLSGVAALAIMTTSANAAVTLENDGTGDYLLFPATYANENGWTTQLKVVNTNNTHAIVARVVIRNGHDSSELFDFPIYLTPGDVWEGTLMVGQQNGHTDRIVVKTSDDSAMLWSGSAGHIVRANVEGPLEMTVGNDDPKLDVPNQTTQITDGRRSTYVEVLGLAAYDAQTVATAKGITWAVGKPLDKVAFFEYVRNVQEGTPKVQLTTPGVLNDLYDSHQAIADVDNDSLLGKQVIVNDAAKLNMALNAVALGELSTAPRTSQVIGTATKMALMTDKGAAVVSEIENVLAKDEIYVMNEGANGAANPMRIHFTDPTKKMHEENADLNTYYLGSGSIVDHYYTYFQFGHDMEENLTICAPEGGNTDYSNDGFKADDCNSSWVYYEVQQINTYNGDVKYMFNDGGFLTFQLEQNTSVVPTSFSSSVLSGSPVNYHIPNQYKKGVDNHVNP